MRAFIAFAAPKFGISLTYSYLCTRKHCGRKEPVGIRGILKAATKKIYEYDEGYQLTPNGVGTGGIYIFVGIAAPEDACCIIGPTLFLISY